MNHIYLTIRKITVAPILAAVMLAVLMFFEPEIFQSAFTFVLGLLFLGLFPISAYPMQKYIPAYRDKGREGQRSLAMIFAVAGYVLGIITGILTHAPEGTMIIYLEYLLSGFLIFIFNKFFHRKISGHACGVFAPICLFLYFGLYTCAALGCIAAVFVYIASLQTKRHTLPQLIGGSMVPFVVLFLNCFFGNSKLFL